MDRSLNHRLEWDIEIGHHIKHLHDLKAEIHIFQDELKESFEKSKCLDFSYRTKLTKRAQDSGLEIEDYVELIEDNQFLVDEWNKTSKNYT